MSVCWTSGKERLTFGNTLQEFKLCALGLSGHIMNFDWYMSLNDEYACVKQLFRKSKSVFWTLEQRVYIRPYMLLHVSP